MTQQEAQALLDMFYTNSYTQEERDLAYYRLSELFLLLLESE